MPAEGSVWVAAFTGCTPFSENREMPHLHLPADHSPADLALAHRVAEAVESSELYVAWSRGGGGGQRPEVQAHVRDEPSVFVETIATVLAWIGDVVEALITKPRTAQPAPAGAPQRAPRTRPAA